MIELPEWPGPRSVTPREMDFGGFLEAPGGAETQRANHPGNRYAATFEMPILENAKEGRIWVNRLLKGKKVGARIAYPLLDFDPGTPNRPDGSPIIVDGAGQSGVMLAVQNIWPGYAFVEGQPISLEISGQHYLDFVAEPAVVAANGKVTIQLTNMLRKPLVVGSILHVAKPMMEGFVMGDAFSWEIALERYFNISFEIRETR